MIAGLTLCFQQADQESTEQSVGYTDKPPN